MNFEALRVDALPVDDDLLDAGTTGPELAYLAAVYRHSPRALIWRNPSSEWRLFALLPPLASRLSLMTNPIFAQLTRSWGLNVRFVGVDRDGLVHDFRSLLSDRTLRMLVELLGAQLDEHSGGEPRLLDTLFAALAREMLTIIQRRTRGWGRHLDVEHRLEPLCAASLFARESRYPDFLACLRTSLRNGLIDVEFYGRVLRAVDLRELNAEERIAAQIESTLDPVTVTKLERAGIGLHLGCYNWLRLDPRHAAPRAHALARLPGFAAFFAEALVPIQAASLELPDEDPLLQALHDEERADAQGPRDEDRPTLDLRRIAARTESGHSLRWAGVLQRAIDAGQDRAIIEALAQRFAVDDNVIRRLWRETPTELGQPPTWHLAQILSQLARCDARRWPSSAASWQELIASAIPAEAG